MSHFDDQPNTGFSASTSNTVVVLMKFLNDLSRKSDTIYLHSTTSRHDDATIVNEKMCIMGEWTIKSLH